MSWTDTSRERKMIETWASTGNPSINRVAAGTSFVEFNNDYNIDVYDFSTQKELSKMLKKYWENDVSMDELIQPCSIAALKCKPREKAEDVCNFDRGEDISISDYVYML